MFRNTSGLLRSGTNRGFTLVEILCVIVILGIASAIIIPQIGIARRPQGRRRRQGRSSPT